MDRQRVEQLFHRHHLRLFRFLCAQCGDRDTAEDLTQEVFVRALAAMNGYSARGKDESWLFRIARNLLVDNYRRQARRGHEVGMADLSAASDVRQPLRQILSDAIDSLPCEDRQLFLMSQLGGLSYRELAEVFSSTENAVRSRLFRARRALRNNLNSS